MALLRCYERVFFHLGSIAKSGRQRTARPRVAGSVAGPVPRAAARPGARHPREADVFIFHLDGAPSAANSAIFRTSGGRRSGEGQGHSQGPGGGEGEGRRGLAQAIGVGAEAEERGRGHAWAAGRSGSGRDGEAPEEAALDGGGEGEVRGGNEAAQGKEGEEGGTEEEAEAAQVQ